MSAGGGLWVFGYGSLMWRPGFPYEERQHAIFPGGHRALCIYSHVHRGTKAVPGLVLGLDAGGRCEGIAYRVADRDIRATLAYLRRREQANNVYRAVNRSILLTARDGEDVRALCYMVNRHHRQYAGDLPLEVQARLVRQGRGRSGINIDYVVNTVRHLRECGIFDRRLEALVNKLGHHRELGPFRPLS
ncbi:MULTISPECIES: gamma-glutamylcyclotransferase [Rhodomicrobium]|uniref:gamma-glutamylcyclotransferase n=1 Tax=Rhodomicrobium TaxID=1068 RepID=UPI0024781F20|nr:MULTISPECIES: gamma-glutamylcyclotransferase [Rhodomicrobium]